MKGIVMDWNKDLSPKSLEWLRNLGHYRPTATPSDRNLKMGGFENDEYGMPEYHEYLDSKELREIANAFAEAADWLDKRASQEG